MKTKKENPKIEEVTFYFQRKNYYWMLAGVICIALGFLLMMGANANTNAEGIYDPNTWNEDIFSFRRTRFAPFLVVMGFVIEVYAIMKRF